MHVCESVPHLADGDGTQAAARGLRAEESSPAAMRGVAVAEFADAHRFGEREGGQGGADGKHAEGEGCFGAMRLSWLQSHKVLAMWRSMTCSLGWCMRVQGLLCICLNSSCGLDLVLTGLCT